MEMNNMDIDNLVTAIVAVDQADAHRDIPFTDDEKYLFYRLALYKIIDTEQLIRILTSDGKDLETLKAAYPIDDLDISLSAVIMERGVIFSALISYQAESKYPLYEIFESEGGVKYE